MATKEIKNLLPLNVELKDLHRNFIWIIPQFHGSSVKITLAEFKDIIEQKLEGRI